MSTAILSILKGPLYIPTYSEEDHDDHSRGDVGDRPSDF